MDDIVLTDAGKTLGMQLIQALARQLDADISITCNGGTCFSITIPDSR